MSCSDDLQIEDWISAVINEQRPERDIYKTKLGAIIDKRMNCNNTLSNEQRRLFQLDVKDYPMLIRGVVGSGKTAILANMVARLLSQKLSESDDLFNGAVPLPKIALTCFNRTIVPFIKEKIKISYKQQTKHDLPDGAIIVRHLNGLLHDVCKAVGWPLSYIRINELKIFEESYLEYLEPLGSFESLLESLTSFKSLESLEPIKNEDRLDRTMAYIEQIKQLADSNRRRYESMLFDVIFVDEGQDLLQEEYQLILDMIKPNPKTNKKSLIIFYDDAQNLYAHSRPKWKEMGIDMQGRSKVLKRCYRCPLEIVELGFNILLGSKASNSLSGAREFADLNYLKHLNLVKETDDYFEISFAKRCSRRPDIRKFNSRLGEMRYISSFVLHLIEKGYVRPEDILIMFHQFEEFRDLVNIIKLWTILSQKDAMPILL
ncbi:TPA: hypothetical protein ENS27_03375 [bacterium]|nr:hypothetical protein [bacterium]